MVKWAGVGYITIHEQAVANVSHRKEQIEDPVTLI